MTEPEPRFPKVMAKLPPIAISRDTVYRCAENQAAFAYWQSCCHGRPMPSRADIDPVEMRGFLAHVALIETPDGSVARPDYRISLAGTAIEAVLGPLTGKLLQQAVAPAVARRWRGLYEVVVTEAAPIRATSRVSFEEKNFLMTELMVAPLSRHPLRVEMLFVTLAFWSERNPPPG